jgi:hypothetical protein
VGHKDLPHFEEVQKMKEAIYKKIEYISEKYIKISFLMGVLTVLGLPGDFLFSVDPVARRLEIHSKIVFRSGKDPFRRSAKRVRNALCVAITEQLFS